MEQVEAQGQSQLVRQQVERQLSVPRIPKIKKFLEEKLKLDLHPKKIFIKTLSSGVDFLGWVNFPDYRILRTVTRRRVFKHINTHSTPETINSYLGLLSHGNTYKIRSKILDRYHNFTSKQD